jgi:hypothetical protein
MCAVLRVSVSTLCVSFTVLSVRAAAGSLRSISIDTTDVFAARLFAGWLTARLRWSSAVAIDIRLVEGDPATPLVRVTAASDGLRLALGVRPGASCLEASVDGAEATARIVPLGNGSLASLIGEELGVRTRDLAFEQALVVAREIPA